MSELIEIIFIFSLAVTCILLVCFKIILKENGKHTFLSITYDDYASFRKLAIDKNNKNHKNHMVLLKVWRLAFQLTLVFGFVNIFI